MEDATHHYTPAAHSLAMAYSCKYLEVSALLGINVETLLVGMVKQGRLRQQGRDKKLFKR